MLIAFEGIDGSGKSTQAAMLRDHVKASGREAVLTKEPTTGPWGQKIRDSLFTQRLSPADELDAFVNDRKEHVSGLIKPALDRGAVVIVDRYYYSSVAYQGARGLVPAEVLKLNEAFAPRPDIVFLVDVDPKIALERIAKRGGGRDLFETLEELTRVRELFTSLAMSHRNFYVIDGSQEPEHMQARVLTEYLRRRS